MVLPDDVQAVFAAVARHRLHGSQGGRIAARPEIDALLAGVAIP